MANSWRSLRRRILTPNVSATKLSVRGFPEKNPATRDLLETVGATFLTGYAHTVEARTLGEAGDRLETVPDAFRGFAYEGAGMGAAVLDALPFGNGRLEALLAGRGDLHNYMIYVGAGWAMARVPRFTWSRIRLPDPLLRWLALDGYGFHQAYFKTAKYVHGQHREKSFPWPPGGPAGYAERVIDQGIGRAMWFVAGGDPQGCADLIDGFAEDRHPDLYGGAGLAATYAGGVSEAELRGFADRAGPHRPQLAQGSAFAAEARVRAGLVTPHTRLASRVLCGLTPEESALVCHETRPGPQESGPGGVPAYEVWRKRIAERFAVSQKGISR